MKLYGYFSIMFVVGTVICIVNAHETLSVAWIILLLAAGQRFILKQMRRGLIFVFIGAIALVSWDTFLNTQSVIVFFKNPPGVWISPMWLLAGWVTGLFLLLECPLLNLKIWALPLSVGYPLLLFGLAYSSNHLAIPPGKLDIQAVATIGYGGVLYCTCYFYRFTRCLTIPKWVRRGK